MALLAHEQQFHRNKGSHCSTIFDSEKLVIMLIGKELVKMNYGVLVQQTTMPQTLTWKGIWNMSLSAMSKVENRGANREGPGRGDGDREDKILFPLHLLVLLSSVLWYVLHVTCYM